MTFRNREGQTISEEHWRQLHQLELYGEMAHYRSDLAEVFTGWIGIDDHLFETCYRWNAGMLIHAWASERTAQMGHDAVVAAIEHSIAPEILLVTLCALGHGRDAERN